MGNIVEKYHKKDDDANGDIQSYCIGLGTFPKLTGALLKCLNACHFCLGHLDNTVEIDLEAGYHLPPKDIAIKTINTMEDTEYDIVSMEELD